ncbi:MAG TPA: energy transducer TonB [Blastocatellia bacterium]|nr:energy transducer TonB [Blastocatellia bacterium]
MRQSHVTTILLTCFFLLIVGSRFSIFAQQPPQALEKERGIELYRKGDFNEAVKALRAALKKLIIQGLDHGLTEQAIEAARKIRFTPAMRDGKPVSVIGSLEFTFDLY